MLPLQIGRFLRHPGKPVILAMSRPDAKKNVTSLVRAYGSSRVLRDLANLVLVLVRTLLFSYSAHRFCSLVLSFDGAAYVESTVMFTAPVWHCNAGRCRNCAHIAVPCSQGHQLQPKFISNVPFGQAAAQQMTRFVLCGEA